MKRRTWITGAIILVGLGLAGCSNSGSGSTKPKQVLNWTEPTDLATADLSQATDTLSFNTLMNTQEGLYRLNKSGTPKARLATNTKISKDGKTYTINLRKGAKWTNGDPVVAKDFVYSWQRTVNPKTASQDAFYFFQVKNAQSINSGKKPMTDLGIKANGKYKLTITLTKPVSYFKKLLAWPLFYPVNQNAVNKYGKKYGTESKYTVSDGPFKLTKWTGNKTWTLAKNNSYWDKKAVKLQEINEQVTESTTTSYNLYQAGKVDETLLSGQQVAANKSKQNFVKRLPTGTVRLNLNQKRVKAFNNVDVRKAFSLAIDRQALTKDILKDGSVTSKGFVPSGMGQNPKTGQEFQDEAYTKSGVSYNLPQAKKLLTAGLKKTNTKSISADLLVSDTDSSKQTAEYIQTELEKLPNVKITIRSVPAVQLFTDQAKKNYDLTLATWQSVFADPINFLDVYESNSSYNTQGWNNKQFDNLLNQSENKYANQPAKRWNKLVQAEKVLVNDQGTIPLYQAAKSQLLNSKVKGIVYNPAGVPYDWKTTYITK